ncbi:uncharacterized protein MELLADRAFT_108292 [Melampsora larici-populina 98AG31]|uniref:Uncharacterized protein n=1 Tax=Melampsora larici-populina (strain 98AG31 / pathotype 3-4-7) TaxID=747676 RepID=F4RSL7_MELLP|nr:uncharacterized protein MELLADRAFT_108292 [Melampsora larici-populina 98AG31]EGG04669.1 hypothetical protein MELLADRAFT_108292 [Melampsora larici-populina 98AG31]
MASLLHGRTLRPRGPTPGPSIVTTQEKTQEKYDSLEKIDEMQIDGDENTELQMIEPSHVKEINVKGKKGKGKNTKKNLKNLKNQKEEVKPTGIELEAQGGDSHQERRDQMNEDEVQINEHQRNEIDNDVVGDTTVGFVFSFTISIIFFMTQPDKQPLQRRRGNRDRHVIAKCYSCVLDTDRVAGVTLKYTL